MYTYRMRVTGLRSSRLAILVGSWLIAGCAANSGDGEPSLHIKVHTTPPPDDVDLSPLLDTGILSLELRNAQTNELMAGSRAGWLPSSSDQPAPQALPDLNLGLVEPFGRRDLKLSVLGTAAQVLGQAVVRGVQWDSGQSVETTLELRRPLAFFGGGKLLSAAISPQNSVFSPSGKNLSDFFKDGTLLRVLNPSSVDPFLSKYDRSLDPSAPVTAVAGTFDGRSLLVVNTAGRLHLIDTLVLKDVSSLALPDPNMRATDIVISPDDQSAVVITAAAQVPPVGRVGQLIFVRDLDGFRARQSDGSLLAVDIESTAMAPMNSPLTAAFSQDGQLNVVFSQNPVLSGQPDCIVLGAGNSSVIATYDAKTGTQIKLEKVPYTTGISFTSENERILVQPCITAQDGAQSGQIVIQRSQGAQILFAPGVLDAAATDTGLLVIGRDNNSDSIAMPAFGAVRKLDQGSAKWTSSLFRLPEMRVPYRITLDGSGNPYPSSLDIVLAPSDFHVYRLVVTPDRTRAIVLARVTQRTRGLFLSTTGSGSATVNCFLDYSGYTYHVMLINLQVGAPEYDVTVGLQVRSCGSRSFDATNKPLGACFNPCDPNDPQPYIVGFQDGYIPTAAGVMFGRR